MDKVTDLQTKFEEALERLDAETQQKGQLSKECAALREQVEVLMVQDFESLDSDSTATMERKHGKTFKAASGKYDGSVAQDVLQKGAPIDQGCV